MTTTGKKVSRQSELEMMRQQLAELQRRLEGTLDDSPMDDRIPLDDYISVMSLLPYNLNLSTKEGGQGSTKKFTKFGEVKKILYKDLVDILEVHVSFLEAGYFYILDNRVIRHHGLDDIYSKILTKEKIEQILSTNSDESVSLYESANAGQQEIIIQLIINKLYENPDSVNLNIVDKISRVSKVDITKRVSDMKEFEEDRKSSN